MLNVLRGVPLTDLVVVQPVQEHRDVSPRQSRNRLLRDWFGPHQGHTDANVCMYSRLLGARPRMPGNSARRSAERRSTTRLPQPSEFNLTEVREKWRPVQEAPVAVVRLAQDMNRTVLLASLGALQGRRQKITHALPEARAADIPPGATPTVAGGMRVWQTEAAAGWREMMHPQWVGQVWADQRCRLLDTDPSELGLTRIESANIPFSPVSKGRIPVGYTTLQQRMNILNPQK